MIILSLSLLVAFAEPLPADTIHLKNGRRMHGKIVKRTLEQVVLDVGTGKVTLALAEIDSIEFGDPHALTAATPRTQAPSPPPAALPSRESSSSSPLAELLLGGSPEATPQPEELSRLADELLPEISRLRGLRPRAAITKRVAGKATIQRIIQEQLARQYPAGELANKGKAMVMFGLLPPSVNLEETIVQLYTQQVAGMYDPYADVLYLADWLPPMLQAGTVAHELVHALQDQHYDLAAYLDQVKGDSEAETARQAVVEGEAVAVTLDYQLQGQGQSFSSLGDLTEWIALLVDALLQQDPSTAATPQFLKELMVFPYIHGLRFLQAFRQRHEWSEMARLYRDPPRSTEQIMHPDKYLGTPDHPTPVHLADARESLGPSWVRIDEDGLGEFSIQFLLKQAHDPELAAGASAGWDGDRYQFYEEDATDKRCLVWRSVWDSVEDAREFAQAYQAVLASKYGGLPMREQGPERWQLGTRGVWLERRGTSVLVLEGAPPYALESLLSLLWQSRAG